MRKSSLKKRLTGAIITCALLAGMLPAMVFAEEASMLDSTKASADPAGPEHVLTLMGLEEGDTAQYYQIITQDFDSVNDEGKTVTGTQAWKLTKAVDYNGDGIVDGTENIDFGHKTVGPDGKIGTDDDVSVKGLFIDEMVITTFDEENNVVTSDTRQLTKEMVNAIASAVTQNSLANSITADGSATADANGKIRATNATDSGMYMFVAVPGPKNVNYIYKPIFVSLDYYNTVSGPEDNTHKITLVTTDDNGDAVYADYTDGEGGDAGVFKKSPLSIDKKSGTYDENGDPTDLQQDVAVGDTVYFSITAPIPTYSANYVAPMFYITDVLTEGLKLNKDSIQVAVNNGDSAVAVTQGKDYGIFVKTADETTEGYADFSNTSTDNKENIATGTQEGFVVQFYNDDPTTTDKKSDGFLYSVVGAPTVTITYTAVVTETDAQKFAQQVNQMDNTAKLNYSKDPNYIPAYTLVPVEEEVIGEDGNPVMEEVPKIDPQTGEPIIKTDPETGEPIPKKDENGNPIPKLDEEGNPIPKTDDEGNPILVTDDEGNPVPKTDENGNPIPKLDDDGNPIPKTDDEGNPILKTDDEGNPIPKTDEEGDPIQAVDEDGNPAYEEVPKKDENGDPIPKLDDEGNPVTDEDGNPVYETEKVPVYEYETEVEYEPEVEIEYEPEIETEEKPKTETVMKPQPLEEDTNKPNTSDKDGNPETIGKLEDKTRHYTFDIDADVLGRDQSGDTQPGPGGEGQEPLDESEHDRTSEIRKIWVASDGQVIQSKDADLVVKGGEEEDGVSNQETGNYGWLEGAEFTLTRTKKHVTTFTGDGDGTEKFVDLEDDDYEEMKFDPKSHIRVTSGGENPKSDAKGYIAMKGLDAGVYILKEIKAPLGYSFNPNVQYEITITPTYVMEPPTPEEGDTPEDGKGGADDLILKSYEVKIVTQELDDNLNVVGSSEVETISTYNAKLDDSGNPVSFLKDDGSSNVVPAASGTDGSGSGTAAGTGGIEADDDNQTATVVNKKLGLLPATGGTGFYFYLLIGGAVAAFFLFLIHKVRKAGKAA